MIDKEQVKHIAKLARIRLNEKEVEKFKRELSSVLDYVEKLKEVDTENVEPISQVTGLENVMREDIPARDKKKERRSKLIKQAPRRKGDYFKVPRILE